jgi:DNA polymerase-3 subunit delta'
MSFELVLEQEGAKRLLAAALREGPAHAYLFHGPPGVGKRTAALAFAAELLGDAGRVERRAHPDLYVLEPVGEQIRIDAIRTLRHDLHMRPFEASRRVYLVFGADHMNEDAADALLKDLEEPPAYAVMVLVADELGPLPETIRSRCQLVPFHRLSRRVLETFVSTRRPGLAAEALAAVVRVAAGRLDRADRLLDGGAIAQRDALLELARTPYAADRFDAGAAARVVMELARAAGDRAREAATAEEIDETPREREQRARRAARGAERLEIIEALELLAGWYRDLVAAAVGAHAAALNADRLPLLAEDGSRVGAAAAVAAAEAVAETRRRFELQVFAQLALEALFVELRRALGRATGIHEPGDARPLPE